MKKAQRMTRQKKVILDVLCATTSHPSAEWIYQEARKEIPGISLGTVYRNLNLLRDNGEILELCYGSGQSHYDGLVAQHYHFCCEGCGRVFNIDLPVLSQIEARARSVSPFRIDGHRLEFYGLCDVCKEATA